MGVSHPQCAPSPPPWGVFVSYGNHEDLWQLLSQWLSYPTSSPFLSFVWSGKYRLITHDLCISIQALKPLDRGTFDLFMYFERISFMKEEGNEAIRRLIIGYNVIYIHMHVYVESVSDKLMIKDKFEFFQE